MRTVVSKRDNNQQTGHAGGGPLDGNPLCGPQQLCGHGRHAGRGYAETATTTNMTVMSL